MAKPAGEQGAAVRVARAARRRLLLRDGLRLGGISLSVGAGLGLGLVTAERLFGLAARVGGGVPWWCLLAAPMGVAGLVTCAAALRRQGSLIGAAQHLDRSMGLRDRISNAVAFSEPLAVDAGSAPFARVAVLDGVSAAADVNIRRAVPVPMPGTWWAWPALLASALAVGIYVPQMNLLHQPPAPKDVLAAESRERQEVAQEIAKATEVVKPEAESGPDAAPPPELREKLAALEEIERQLKAGQRTPEEARKEAARSVNDLADQLAKSSQALRRTTDAVRSSLASAGGGTESGETRGAGGDGGGERLTRALRSGDLQAAREAVESLQQQLPEMTAQEREATAEAMERYAEDLEALTRQAEAKREREAREAEDSAAGRQPPEKSPSPKPAVDDRKPGPENPARAGEAEASKERGERAPAQQSPAESARTEPGTSGPSENLQKELQRQGLSKEQARRAAAQPDKETARRELEQSGIDPEAAERLAERIDQERQQQEAQREAEQKAEDLARNLKDAAKSIRERQPEPPSPAREPTAPERRQREGDGSQAGEGQTTKPSQDRGGQPAQPQPGAARPGEQSGSQGSEPKPSAPQDGQSTQEQRNQQTGPRPATGEPTKPGERTSAGEGERRVQPQSTQDQPGRGNEPGNQADRQLAGAEEKPGSRTGEGQKGTKPGAEGEKQPSDQQGAGTRPKPDSQPGQDRSGPRPDPNGRDGNAPKKPDANSPGIEPSPEPGNHQPKDGTAGSKTDWTQTPGEQASTKPVPGDRSKPTPQPSGSGEPGAAPRPAPGIQPQPNRPEGSDGSKEPRSETRQAGDGDPDATKQPGEGHQPKPGSDEGGPSPSGVRPRAGAKPDSRQPGGEETGAPDAQPGSDRQPRKPPESGGSADSLERLAKQVRDISNAENAAQRDQRASEELRERARRMYENADPQTRREMERWAREMAKQQRESSSPSGPGDADAPTGDGPGGGMNPSGPSSKNRPSAPSQPREFRTEVVDARGANKPGATGRERVVAEWLGDGKPGSAPTPADVESRLQEAARSAERAVDDRVVHSRYDKLLRRYFRRLPENIAPTGDSNAPPVQPAKDVP